MIVWKEYLPRQKWNQKHRSGVVCDCYSNEYMKAILSKSTGGGTGCIEGYGG